jgi:hypothetical protein
VNVLPRPSSSSFLGSSVSIDQSLVVRDFNDLKRDLPFIGNLTGIVTQSSGVTYSRAGAAMKHFRLQDSSGRYVNCCAHGRHSDNDAIEERAQVLIFLATATPSLGQLPPVVWLFDNSHMVLQRRNCVVPPVLEAVALGSTTEANSSQRQSGA